MIRFSPRTRAPFCVLAAGSALLFAPLTAHADDSSHKAWNFASQTGNIIYLAAGVGLPLLEDGSSGRNHALRAADAVGTSVLLSEGLKHIFREKRPDSSERNSFPSGHATAAFAIATVQSQFHPRQAPLWYLGAALIAESRVRLHRHYDRDIIAGAVLGYGTARMELAQPRGLILSPWIESHRGSRGLQFSRQF